MTISITGLDAIEAFICNRLHDREPQPSWVTDTLKPLHTEPYIDAQFGISEDSLNALCCGIIEQIYRKSDAEASKARGILLQMLLSRSPKEFPAAAKVKAKAIIKKNLDNASVTDGKKAAVLKQLAGWEHKPGVER